MQKKIFGYLEISSRRALNCVKVNSHNSLEHESLKFFICYELRKRGVDFYTEAKFTGNIGIADIICFNPNTGIGKIIEILHSETLEEAKEKTKKYPDDIEIVYADTNKFQMRDLDV